MPTLLALLFLIPVQNAVAAPFTVDSSTIYASGGYVGIDTTTFLMGGIFHVAAPANTHTYYDFDRVSPSFDSAITWGSNGLRSWYLGFLPSVGSANTDLTLYNSSAGKAVQTFQDSTGNIGIGTTNPTTLLDVNGSGQFGSGATKSTFSTTGALTLASGAALTLSGTSGNITAASSVTASAFFGDGSHLSGISASGGGHSISTGTLTTGATPYTTRPALTFDSQYFAVSDLPTLGESFVTISTPSSTGWTRTVFTSGSGTYNTPAGVTEIRIRLVGGGGGGGATVTNAGSAGGDTTFSSLTGSGGNGGAQGTGASSTAPIGATGGAASGGDVNISGGDGAGGSCGDGGTYSNGGLGGASPFGGGASGGNPQAAGANAASNSGAGGGGAGGSVTSGGAGGGAGGYVEASISIPASSYSYSVGSGGNGGTAGTYKGGNGGSGLIIIDEYHPFVSTGGSGDVIAAGNNTFTGLNIFQSTTTVGPSSAVTALDYSHVIRGGISEVGEYTISGSTTVTFTNYNPKYPHHVTFVGSCAGAAYQMNMQVNGDTSGDGSWGGSYLCNGGGVTAAGNVNQASLPLTGATNQTGSTSTIHLDLETLSHASGTQAMTGTVNAQWQNSAGNVNAVGCSWNGYIAYNGATGSPRSITFNSGSASAKCLGNFWVTAFVPVVDPAQ